MRILVVLLGDREKYFGLGAMEGTQEKLYFAVEQGAFGSVGIRDDVAIWQQNLSQLCRVVLIFSVSLSILKSQT